MKKSGNNLRLALTYLLPFLVIAIMISMFNRNMSQPTSMNQNQLVDALRKDNVKSIVIQGDKIKGTLRTPEDGVFETVVPEWNMERLYNEYIEAKVIEGKVNVVFEKKAEKNVFVEMLPDFLFLLIIVFFLYTMYRRTQQQNGAANNFGKSKAKLNKDEGKKITFSDVAGLKEEKEELSEIVEFLKNPRKFTSLGARIPKGVLLVGPPGTGKTYLSKAVAGEAGVPFFSISGSDFVEMFVGVGASRVRNLFEEGKKNAPCIIFIDEIDAVGRRRGAGLGGGNDEREQTLNQLLVEMDGFDVNEGIIIMAATNRPDILDPAIVRPGRFDRQVMIGMPDVNERGEILNVHLRNKKVAEDVDLHAVARQTAGFTPADLENMCNEAVLLTARQNNTVIDMKTFEEAAIKVVAGPEKKSKRVLESERRITAYHEAGHAIVTRALPDMDEVNLITIIPRGMAGGFTSFLPPDDRNYMSKNQMKNELVTLLGGRAAEALVLDDISTGASNDIERATGLARSMIVKYGMNEDLGPVAYEEGNNNVFLGNDIGKVRTYSEKTAVEIDKAIRTIMKDSMSRAMKILSDNREALEQVAQSLLEKETLHREEFENIFLQYGNTVGENKEETI